MFKAITVLSGLMLIGAVGCSNPKIEKMEQGITKTQTVLDSLRVLQADEAIKLIAMHNVAVKNANKTYDSTMYILDSCNADGIATVKAGIKFFTDKGYKLTDSITLDDTILPTIMKFNIPYHLTDEFKFRILLSDIEASFTRSYTKIYDSAKRAADRLLKISTIIIPNPYDVTIQVFENVLKMQMDSLKVLKNK